EQTSLVAEVSGKGERLRERLAPLLSHPNVGSIRGRGLMVGIELVADSPTHQPFPAAMQLGRSVCRRAGERGVWIRPLSDVIVLMPPLIATETELDMLADVVIDSIQMELDSIDVASTASLASGGSN
ncbi:MAG: aminotransferase class III-fold pyridoxal phosphate-dependent enzyme, partial [Rubripirellula sp.]